MNRSPSSMPAVSAGRRAAARRPPPWAIPRHQRCARTNDSRHQVRAVRAVAAGGCAGRRGARCACPTTTDQHAEGRGTFPPSWLIAPSSSSRCCWSSPLRRRRRCRGPRPRSTARSRRWWPRATRCTSAAGSPRRERRPGRGSPWPRPTGASEQTFPGFSAAGRSSGGKCAHCWATEPAAGPRRQGGSSAWTGGSVAGLVRLLADGSVDTGFQGERKFGAVGGTGARHGNRLWVGGERGSRRGRRDGAADGCFSPRRRRGRGSRPRRRRQRPLRRRRPGRPGRGEGATPAERVGLRGVADRRRDP